MNAMSNLPYDASGEEVTPQGPDAAPPPEAGVERKHVAPSRPGPAVRRCLVGHPPITEVWRAVASNA